MFHVYEYLEIVTVCQPLQKHKMMKGDKKLEKLNADILIFTYQFLKLTRKDTRIIHWPHKRLRILTESASIDGTHPDTVGGYWQYQRSISACCRYSKRELYRRRGKSHRAIEKMHIAIRKQHSARKRAKIDTAMTDTDEDEW